nr:5-oxoprolinase subunit PxpB [Haloferula luteola]
MGDSAWLFRTSGREVRANLQRVLRLAERLRAAAIDGVTDVVNSYDTVAVHTDPGNLTEVGRRVRELSTDDDGADRLQGRLIEIPVRYGGEDGPDLEEVAIRLGLSESQVVSLHSEAVFQVATLGFAPGFPYLLGLPEALQLGRKATPRMVLPGAVAIAGAQAGIYPCASPAGWWVLGRTDFVLFDGSRDVPGTLNPGDRVRFVPTREGLHFPKDVGIPENHRGEVEVLEAGPMTTIQSKAREGFRRWGVTPGGAADPVSMIAANAMVGNPGDAAVLEVTLSGPRLRFDRAAHVAWLGWRGGGKMVDVLAGEVLDLRSPLGSVRGVIAVSGGVQVPEFMGSRATDCRAGFGGFQGRRLMAGDRLGLGLDEARVPKPGGWRVGWPPLELPGGEVEVRVLRGVQAHEFDDSTRRTFLSKAFRVSGQSDRMGMRLEGPRLESAGREMVSQPVVAGSIQVPPDGHPIVLMPESQTLGGYPQVAHVISADLPRLARVWPGTVVHFREVELDEAILAWQELTGDLERLRLGLSFLMP